MEHNMSHDPTQIIKLYLEKLWLQDKQAEIFLMVYQYWPKPASTIANLAKTERSYCYKVLEDMVREWYVDQIISLWIKQYYINSIYSLQKTIEKKEQEVRNLKEEFTQIQWEFKELDKQKSPYIPKIQQYQDRPDCQFLSGIIRPGHAFRSLQHTHWPASEGWEGLPPAEPDPCS